MTTDLLIDDEIQSANGAEPLALHCVEENAQAAKAARSDDPNAVWIVRTAKLANRVVQNISWPSRRAGFLVWIGNPRPAVLPALERRFVRVVFAAKSNGFLPKEELKAVLKSPNRRDRFVGGMIDKESQIVTLWRGDLTSCVAPFSAFPPTPSGNKPDWDRFKVTDYGNTLNFGDYESAADAVLYEYDANFRRRLNKISLDTDSTLGASIRRLRKQRRLTRNDFSPLDPKTLGRIERGEVVNPHANTLDLIANRLGVSAHELDSF
ncbi:MAG TPA: helix-turn-helix transcriptional regulator [Humisphaera sp.]|nr:helix-turn-helix transcriptional regulator [Humisphaera sp.]